MERNHYESYPMPVKREAAVANYHEIAGRDDDDDLGTRYIPANYGEKPKTVLRKGLCFSKFIIHIVALATTAAVVGVNFANVYGWDEASLNIGMGTSINIHIHDNQVTTILQFAAKIHEILIVGSLSSIVMHRIRKRLVGSSGLPIGLLSSGYRVDSLGSLFSGGIRSAFSTDGWLILTLAATIILANIVGPSSAIVQIPRLAWWNIRGGAVHKPMQLYMDGSVDELYPINLDPPNMTIYAGCDTIQYTSGCPGAAFENLKNWAGSWYNNGVQPNVSMTEESTNTQRAVVRTTAHMPFANLMNLTEPNTNFNISITTSLTQPILELAGLYWNYIEENSKEKTDTIRKPMLVSTDTSPIYAPVVQVECAYFNYSEVRRSPGPDNPVVSFPLDVLDNYTSISDTIAWPVDPSLWNFTRTMNATNFTWVDVSSYSDGNGPGASLGALVTLPTLAFDDTQGRNDTFWAMSQQSLVVPCLINAKWAAAKIQYEPKSSNQIVQNLTTPIFEDVGTGRNATEATRRPWGLSNTIHISPEWADLLNVAGIASTSASGNKLKATMMEALLSQFVFTDANPIYSPYMAVGAKFTKFAPPEFDTAVPATIAAVISEGLSRHAYNLAKPYIVIEQGPNNTTLTGLKQRDNYNASESFVANISLAAFREKFGAVGTPIDFTFKRYGYGYGYQGKSAVAFGLAVLLLYATVATGFIFYSILDRVLGIGFTSSAWDQMGEMLALALHSKRASTLENVGGGVSAKETWRMRVRVRERGENRLELVVGNDDLEDARPQFDKKYQ